MKLPTQFKLALALGLIATPALAHEPDRHPGQQPIWVAQLSEKEREHLRERWEHMPPEQRNDIRRELRERLDQTPPERREELRNRLIERLDKAGKTEYRRQHEERTATQQPTSNGFGQGFEHRRHDDTWPNDRLPPAGHHR